MTEEQARNAGYTRPFLAETLCQSHEILVQEDVDFDDLFTAYSLYDNRLIRIQGWNVECHDLSEEA